MGDRFLLGAFAWQITDIGKDTVVVAPTSQSAVRVPFWKGEIKGRSIQTGMSVQQIFSALTKAHDEDALLTRLSDSGSAEAAAEAAGTTLSGRSRSRALFGRPHDHCGALQ